MARCIPSNPGAVVRPTCVYDIVSLASFEDLCFVRHDLDFRQTSLVYMADTSRLYPLHCFEIVVHPRWVSFVMRGEVCGGRGARKACVLMLLKGEHAT